MILNDTSKAMIFDMDGTLIASTHVDYMAWKKLFADHGISFTYEQYVPVLGIKSAELAATVLQLEGKALQDALKKKLEYFNETVANEGLHVIPYTHELLGYLQQHHIRMALATSSRRIKMQQAMEHVQLLQYFDTIVTGEDVVNGKPAPDIFLLAAERLNANPADCIVFEDSARGVSAAKTAGMYCVAITTSHTPGELRDADLVIDSFHELMETGCAADQQLK